MKLRHFGTLFGLLLGAFSLAACTSAHKTLIGQGVERGRQAKDAEAEILKASLCAMSVGAYYRVNNDIERRAVDVLCGGDWQPVIDSGGLHLPRDQGGSAGGS